MFRRARFSVRPNVGTAGRAATATPQETPPASQEPSETPKEIGDSNRATDVTSKPDVILSEKGEGNDLNGEGTKSSAALQRRKRFSIKPKVAPGRPPTLSRTPKSPVKVVSVTPVEASSTDLSKPSTSTQDGMTAVPHGLQSPRQQRHSEDSKQQKTQPDLTPIPSEHSGPSPVEIGEDSPDGAKQAENFSGSQVKDIPARPPDKVPPSLPDKEASEISEKAKTLVSSKNVLSLSSSALSLSRLLNSPSDLQRLAKAQKLRELLRQERCKEKRLKKAKFRSKEFTLDPTKMTMRDLIHYLPTSNPMMSSLEDLSQENETVVPPSPEREESPEQAQEPEVQPTKVSSGEEAVHEEEVAAEEEEDEEALMVPQVKVAEDGSLIIDEESLTVEVQRAKGPNPAEGREPIFERGSTTTYSSFRKATYTKPWSIEETDMFFLAVSMVGTDFSMICQLFPHRARSEIKNKFKKEERLNSWRIDKAFRERRKLDIEYFSKLLDKVLEVQKDKKNLKLLYRKNATKTRKTKAKGKKSGRRLSDVEEEDENEVSDLEEEAQKENEDQCNEGGDPAAAEPKKKRKRKKKADALTEEPTGKKKKRDLKSNEQSEAGIPEDSEAALPDDHTNSDMTEKTPNGDTAKDTAVKPAKLSRGRAPKPLVPLGLKKVKKPAPSKKSKETTPEKGGECENDGGAKEEVNKDELPLSQGSQAKSPPDDISSEEEDATVKPQKPTRYGRVPKPIQPLNYAPKQDPPLSASEATLASPSASKSTSKRTAKRGKSSKPQSDQKFKKPKLVTLRSSKSDFSDDDEETEWETVDMPLVCSSSQDSEASEFAPASIHPSNSEISEVDEAMVELDILASMPDVLGISQDGMCPDSSCQQGQHETGTAEPCEHQLDLLVDVIDFLSNENSEVSQDESYNEAAQTLLTIGNVAHVSQSASETAEQDCTTGTTSAGVNEFSHLEEETVSAELKQNVTAVFAAFGQEATETTETAASLDLQGSLADSGEKHCITATELKSTCDLEPDPQLQTNPDKSNETGPFSRVKPKPNLSQTSRTAQPEVQMDILTERKAERSHAVATNLFQASESPSATEETASKISDSAQASLKHDISTTEVKLVEVSSDIKERFDDQVESDAATSDPNSSVMQSSSFPESASYVSAAETSLNESSTSDSSKTEIVQESSVKGPTSPAEDLPVSQKEGSKTVTPSQHKRTRFPKVKPKPNLPQTSKTARYTPQTTEEIVEKDSHPTPNAEFHKTAEIESQPTCTQSSTLQPTEELPLSTDMVTCVGPKAVLDVAKPDLTVTETSVQNLSKVHLEPDREASRDTGSTSSFKEDNQTSHTGTTENSSQNVMITDLKLPELQVGQGPNVDSVLVQKEGGNPAAVLTSVEELTVSQGDGKAASTSQSRRIRMQRIKPKPNLPQTSRAARSKPEIPKEPAEDDSSPSPQASIPSSEVQLEPSKEQIIKNEGQVTESIDKRLISHTETSKSRCNETVTLDSGIEVSQVGLTSSALVPEESNSPATLPVSKQDAEAASACQLRRSRLQKPKPNLTQTLKARGSKPQAAKEPVGQESSPNPELQKATADMKPQQPCAASSEKQSESSDPASDSKPSHTEGCMTGLVGQVDSDAQTSDQSVTEKLNLNVQLEPTSQQTTVDKGSTSEITDESPPTHDEITKSCPDQAVTESHVGQESKAAAVKEGNCSPAAVITPAEHLQASQGDSTAASACLLRSRRLQRPKPKPNLPQVSRAARSKPQPAKEPVGKESSPNPELHEKTTAEVKPQQPCAVSPEKQSESSDPASVSKPSHTEGCTTRLVGQVDGDAPTSDLRVPENLKVQLEPTSQQTTADKGSASDITDESPPTHDEITKSCSDQAVPESHVGQESKAAAVKKGNSSPAAVTTPAEHLQASQGDSTAASACLLRSRRLQRPKPKPKLPQMPRAARSKPQPAKEPAEEGSSSSQNSESEKPAAEMRPQPSCSTLPEKQSQSSDAGIPASDQGASLQQNIFEVQPEPSREKSNREEKKTCEFTEDNLTPHAQPAESSLNNVASNFEQSKPEVTKDPVSLVQLVSKPQSSTSRPQSSDDTETEVEAQQTCSTTLETSTTGCASDSAPSLGLTSTPAYTGESSSAEEKLKTDAGVGQVLTSDCAGQNIPQRRQRLSKFKPKPNLGSASRITLRKPKADDGKPSENTSSMSLEKSGGDKSGTVITVDDVSTGQAADTGSVLHEGFQMDKSTKVASSNNQPIANPTAAPDAEFVESKTNPLFTAASPTCSQKDSSVQGMDPTTSELTGSSKTSNKPPQTRRGRLVKPKPNLRCSSRPQHALQAQNRDSTEAVAEEHESDLRPDYQGAGEGFIDKLSVIDSSSNDAPVSVGCVTQSTSSQNALTSSIEGFQSYPLLSQILPEQVPSDPDEPFFILSLTEIPVSSAGDVLNSTAEHLSYLPVTDASTQQPIVSGESAAGDGPVSNAPASTEESDAVGVFNVRDIGPSPAAFISEAERSNLSPQKNPEDLQGNTSVQPVIVDSEETDIPSPKQRLTESGRKAKLPGKSSTREKKQMTPAATETKTSASQISTTQDSDHPGSSVETVRGAKKTLAPGKEPDTSGDLQTAQSVGRSLRNRKAKDFPSFASETKVKPSGKAASRTAKVKTPSAAGKRSVSHDVAPIRSLTQTPEKSHSTSTTSPAQSVLIDKTSDCRHISSDPTPSTSYGTEASASQEGDCAESCSLEDEPTVVSQYFYSDIFTDVEEG